MTPHYLASCSFGKDSLAMVLMLIEHEYPLDEVVFYDTGMEFQAIYDIRDKLLPLLAERGIKYTEIKPDRPFLYDMLEKPVKDHFGYGWCGGCTRWGTSAKLAIIDRYKAQYEDLFEYVGIAYDERHRAKSKIYPLIDWKMTEKDCLNYCHEQGYFWEENGIELYSILDRVSCWCCSNKNLWELYNIWKYLPDYWERLRDLQCQINMPMKKFKNSQFGEYGTVFDLEKIFEGGYVPKHRKHSMQGGQSMSVPLYEHQLEAIGKLQTGSILCGGVGSGKSRTALAYYFSKQGGNLNDVNQLDEPKDLYIITTARKRDTLEWEDELKPFDLDPKDVVVDSWNNIKKYSEVKDAFFIFDEQRVIGSGAWVKSFLKITKFNDWILLSATPGDTWSDYIPVFIANGFYKNRTEFSREHIIYSRFTKYPKVDRYVNTGRLVRYRNSILVDMTFKRQTIPHNEERYVQYDIQKYKDAIRTRWDPYKNEPIQQASGLCYILRRIVNEDDSRQLALLEILEDHPRAIIFYNFDYELDILIDLACTSGIELAQWNGHKHQPIPTSERWVYLVQYTAGCEGWNCITTDTIIFFSQNYSYKVMQQASGRIDRLNTPYIHLYYYHLKSRSGIDLAISKAIREKRDFNESRWLTSNKI